MKNMHVRHCATPAPCVIAAPHHMLIQRGRSEDTTHLHGRSEDTTPTRSSRHPTLTLFPVFCFRTRHKTFVCTCLLWTLVFKALGGRQPLLDRMNERIRK